VKSKRSAENKDLIKRMTNDYLIVVHWEYADTKQDPSGHRVMRDMVSASLGGPSPTAEDMQAATHAAKMELARMRANRDAQKGEET
jgi:hypothetical protein